MQVSVYCILKRHFTRAFKREDTNLNKEQFLHDLTVQLNLNVSDEVIREQIAYYSSYITGEVRKGRSEAEVIEELGSPRLLAKTIIETAEAAGDPVASQDDEIRGTVDLEPDSDAFDQLHAQYENAADASYTEASDESNSEVRQNYEDENHKEQESYSENGKRNDNGWSDPFYRHHHDRGTQANRTGGVHVFDASGWGCIVLFILFFLLFQILVSVVGGVLMFFSPVLLPVLVILVLIWLFKGIFSH